MAKDKDGNEIKSAGNILDNVLDAFKTPGGNKTNNSDSRDQAMREFERSQTDQDINLSLGELAAQRSVSPIIFDGKWGVQTSKLSYDTKVDLGYLLQHLIAFNDSSIGKIEPMVIDGGVAGPYVLSGSDVFLGAAFNMDDRDKEGAPGVLRIIDGGSALEYTAKTVDHRLVGIVWCLKPESQFNYTTALGVHTTESSDRFTVTESVADLTFETTSMNGEVYPLMPTRGFSMLIARFLADVDYTWDELNEDILDELGL